MADKHQIIGVWRVKTVGAPFPYHMFAFHSDGTMQQSNPPFGNKDTSDTAGMGLWEAGKNGAVKARFEEYRLDFKDETVTRGAIDFNLQVDGDKLTGDCAFNIYGVEDDSHIAGPFAATIDGVRVKL